VVICLVLILVSYSWTDTRLMKGLRQRRKQMAEASWTLQSIRKSHVSPAISSHAIIFARALKICLSLGEHGHCNAMYKQRSTRIISKSLWAKIIKVFPNAIMHRYQPPSDKCIGDCKQCYKEKELEERFPAQIKEWRASIEENEVLSTIAREEYNPTISDNSMFNLLHHDLVQGWRNAVSYLKRSKKNVSNDTVRAKLLPLCQLKLPQISLICKEHKQSIIPDLNFDGDRCLKNCHGVELIEESHSSALLNSLSSLEEILQNDIQSSAV
jgi:hypothetical protein